MFVEIGSISQWIEIARGQQSPLRRPKPHARQTGHFRHPMPEIPVGKGDQPPSCDFRHTQFSKIP